MIRKFLLFFVIALILEMNTARCQIIGGDYGNMEPGLKGRQDILFFEGFSTTAWGNNWNNAKEGGNTTTNTTGFDNNCLSIFLKQGAIGTSGSGNTAMNTFLKNFPGVESLHEEMYFRYYIYLDPNFDFSQGGKVPGMASHALYGAGSHPTGGDGWTARYMWNSYGELYLYAYLPLDVGFGSHKYLDYSGKRARLQKGKWHCVEQYIKLNSVSVSSGNADGKCYTWLDGNLCLKLDDVVYRTIINDTGKEFGIYSSIFFGGADSQWAPSYDTYIKIDNMVLAKNYIGPRTGANVLSAPAIATEGGAFSNQVTVSMITNADEIRYTTNGQEPNYWSNKYTNPFKLSKTATVKARAFSSNNVRYSGTSSKIYTINTSAGATPGATNTIKSASADSYFRNGGDYENINYGTEGTLELKSGNFSYDRKAAVKFSVADLTTFSSAKLRIYAASASAASKIGFFEMSSNWTETGITSLNAPIAGDLIQTAIISAAGWIEIDATNYISSQISQGATEIAFYIMVMNDESSNTGVSLRSRTATSNKPELLLVNTDSGLSDSQAPSVPSNLTASNITQTSFTLNWQASNDNVGVTGYEVFRGGISIGTSTGTTFIVTGLTANTTYRMTVKAKDAAGNFSGSSNIYTVTTTLPLSTFNSGLSENDVIVSPNPTHGPLSLTIKDEEIGNYFIDVFDILGAKLYSGSFMKSTSALDVSIDMLDFPSGVYNLKISHLNIKTQRKVVKY